GGDDRAAVAAHVDEAPERVVGVERDHDRHRTGGRGEVAARALQLTEVAGVEPGAMEDAVHLRGQDRWIRVPGPGDRRSPGGLGALPGRGFGEGHQAPSRGNRCVNARAWIRTSSSKASSVDVTRNSRASQVMVL